MSFDQKFSQGYLFINACCCWDGRFSKRVMNQNFLFGGNSVYGDSYLENLFCHFKVFRLNAILHDAAVAVRAHSCKGSCYC